MRLRRCSLPALASPHGQDPRPSANDALREQLAALVDALLIPSVMGAQLQASSSGSYDVAGDEELATLDALAIWAALALRGLRDGQRRRGGQLRGLRSREARLRPARRRGGVSAA